ncbi:MULTISPECIES: ProQ/FINO family protein [Chromobacterium]|uniref:ProQ/FINO family protein n=1 Tax=Chromobacterium sinusclupearum TaxID=2077146 RepID=A0A2K4MNL3_9NEIS|nr:ProQ/FINO family protein [Chromobacterium sinusclupearum]
MKPNTETALGAALKSAVQSLSKKKQTEMIADHIYGKFDVFRQFRPLALGIHESLIASLPQFDSALISRVVANHCRKPRYLKSLARGGKRFDLSGKPQGEVSAEEKRAAELQMQPKNAAPAEEAAQVQPAPADAAPAQQQEGQAES